MEKELNIAAILKDKPKGTKLWSPIFGECTFDEISCNNSYFGVDTNKRVPEIFYANGKYDENGECTIFPSKEMRDWRKFQWKKGDVLVSKDNVYIIFEKFEDDAYTRFKGKHYLWKEFNVENYNKEEIKMLTSVFEKATDDVAQTYIKTIEEHLDGKLNLETLEIEKSQPEFKDGDIIYAESNAYHYPSIHILNTNCDTRRYYARLLINGRYDEAIDYDIPAFDDDAPNRLRFATEEERQQLFDALAKEGKAWDAEKKQIVDLPKKCELNPFDRVLVRDNSKQKWIPDMYRFYDKDEEFPYNCFSSTYKRCIPYNEDTKHLLGTTDEWKGGDE